VLFSTSWRLLHVCDCGRFLFLSPINSVCHINVEESIVNSTVLYVLSEEKQVGFTKTSFCRIDEDDFQLVAAGVFRSSWHGSGSGRPVSCLRKVEMALSEFCFLINLLVCLRKVFL
jgi:hypothetical protein